MLFFSCSTGTKFAKYGKIVKSKGLKKWLHDFSQFSNSKIDFLKLFYVCLILGTYNKNKLHLCHLKELLVQLTCKYDVQDLSGLEQGAPRILRWRTRKYIVIL